MHQPLGGGAAPPLANTIQDAVQRDGVVSPERGGAGGGGTGGARCSGGSLAACIIRRAAAAQPLQKSNLARFAGLRPGIMCKTLAISCIAKRQSRSLLCALSSLLLEVNGLFCYTGGTDLTKIVNEW